MMPKVTIFSVWHSGQREIGSKLVPSLQKPRACSQTIHNTRLLPKTSCGGSPSCGVCRSLRPSGRHVGAVVHVGNENIFHAAIDLRLRLLHGLAEADNDQDNSRSASNKPLTIDLLHVFDVNLLRNIPFKNDGIVLRERFERGFVVEWEWRHDNANSDLKTAARTQRRVGARGKLPKEIADRSEHTFLLNTDRWIAEARSELERVDTVAVDDAIQVYVADVAFFGEFRFHF